MSQELYGNGFIVAGFASRRRDSFKTRERDDRVSVTLEEHCTLCLENEDSRLEDIFEKIARFFFGSEFFPREGFRDDFVVGVDLLEL